jgi:hypothetical protein
VECALSAKKKKSGPLSSNSRNLPDAFSSGVFRILKAKKLKLFIFFTNYFDTYIS